LQEASYCRLCNHYIKGCRKLLTILIIWEKVQQANYDCFVFFVWQVCRLVQSKFCCCLSEASSEVCMKLLIMIIDWVVLLLLSNKVQQANYHCHKFFTDQMDKYQHAPNREDDRVSWSIAWESQLEKNTLYLPCIRGFCVIVWMVAGSFLLCLILEMYYDWSEKKMTVDGRTFLIVSNSTCTQWRWWQLMLIIVLLSIVNISIERECRLFGWSRHCPYAVLSDWSIGLKLIQLCDSTYSNLLMFL
jgi:hypothetical protein